MPGNKELLLICTGVERSFFKRGEYSFPPLEHFDSFRFDALVENFTTDIPQPIKHGDEIPFSFFYHSNLSSVISYEGNVLEPETVSICPSCVFLNHDNYRPGRRAVFIRNDRVPSRTIGEGKY